MSTNGPRLIIAGSRDMPDGIALNFINAHWRSFGIPRAVLSGTCHGVDKAGEKWAEKWAVTVERYPAEWESLGKSAGPKRNAAMVANADALLVIRYSDSRGSLDVLQKAKRRGLHVVDVVIPRPPGRPM